MTVHDIDYLIHELDHVNAGIVGIQETRSKSDRTLKWHTGHTVFVGKSEKGVGGVGFIVHPDLKHLIEKCKIINNLLAILKLNVNGSSLKCINVYMPTCDYDDEHIDEMYESIEQELKEKYHYKIVLGVGVGRRQQGENCVGQYGLNRRNERGQRLVDFAEYNGLCVTNTMFKQRNGRLWTWESPKRTHHLLDYILVNKRRYVINCKAIGMTQCDTRSDHRLVRLSLNMNYIKRSHRKTTTKVIDLENARKAINAVSDEEWKIVNRGDYESLSSILKHVTENARVIKPNPTSRTRLRPETLQLIKERRYKIEKGEDVRYLSKTLRKKVRADYHEFNEKKAIDAALKMKSIRKSREAISLHKDNNAGLKDESGTVQFSTKEKGGIISRFYSQLFASTHDINSISGYTPEDVPEIIVDEIEIAIKKMASGKTPGQDRIAIEILKEAPKKVHEIIA